MTHPRRLPHKEPGRTAPEPRAAARRESRPREGILPGRWGVRGLGRRQSWQRWRSQRWLPRLRAPPVMPAAATKPRPKATTSTTPVPTTTLAPTTTTAPVPAVPAPPAPGGSVAWTPQGRSVLGRPLLYTGSSGGGFVAWMDPQLARPVVVPGSADPGGPWPWGGQVAPESRGFLLASFNGGFKWGDFSGGVLAFGAAYRGLAPGQASLIVYSDGYVHRGRVGTRQRPGEAGGRCASEPAVARRRRTPHPRDGESRRVGRIGCRSRDDAVVGGCRRQRRARVGRRPAHAR